MPDLTNLDKVNPSKRQNPRNRIELVQDAIDRKRAGGIGGDTELDFDAAEPVDKNEDKAVEMIGNDFEDEDVKEQNGEEANDNSNVANEDTVDEMTKDSLPPPDGSITFTGPTSKSCTLLL